MPMEPHAGTRSSLPMNRPRPVKPEEQPASLPGGDKGDTWLAGRQGGSSEVPWVLLGTGCAKSPCEQRPGGGCPQPHRGGRSGELGHLGDVGGGKWVVPQKISPLALAHQVSSELLQGKKEID